MSTIITGVILVAATAGIVWFFILLNRKKTRQRNHAMLKSATRAGAALGLSFSSQEILMDKIIGIDGLRRQLLVFNFKDTEVITAINMADVKECRLKKEYQQVNFGTQSKADVEMQLRTIDINFIFSNKPEPFLLQFYDNTLHSIYEMAALESKARSWEILFNKLIQQPVTVPV